MPGRSRKSRTGEIGRPRGAGVLLLFGVRGAARLALARPGRTRETSRSPICSCRFKPGRGSDGFTLLEVLVALTILGMSLAVLLAIFSQALAREHSRDRAFAARTLAQSLIARTLAAPPAGFGETTGHTDAGLSWRLRIEPHGDSGNGTMTGLQVARVSAIVTWPGASNQQSLTLTTLRLMPKEKSK